jgi:hypothetical protein
MTATNWERRHSLLVGLSSLPKKIVSVHGREDIPAFVLYNLAQVNCFNFNKAAYFVDNPDFNCIKGIAGYTREEDKFNHDGIWEEPNHFADHLRASSFNQRVRSIYHESARRLKKHDHTFVGDIAHTLRLHEPAYYWWRMKHDNHGLLVFEKNPEPVNQCEEYLQHGVHFLSLCPIH